MASKCPTCGKDGIRVIYYALPMWLCEDEECSCLYGFWSDFVSWLPFNGWFMSYEGSYLSALWAWLKGAEEE